MGILMEGNINWKENPPRVVYHEAIGLWELLFGEYGGGYYSTEEEVNFEYNRAVDEIARGVFVFRRYRDKKSPRGKAEPPKKFEGTKTFYKVPEEFSKKNF